MKNHTIILLAAKVIGITWKFIPEWRIYFPSYTILESMGNALFFSIPYLPWNTS